MDCTVVIQINESNREVFKFWFDRTTLVLNEYLEQHKVKRTWHTNGRYDRLSERESTIEECDVPLSEDVKQKAIETFCRGITCMKWSEYKGI